MRTKEGPSAYPRRTFGRIDNQKSIQKIIKKTITQKHGIGYQRGPKMNRNRCQKSSKINAKTVNEKHQENHQNHVSLNRKNIEIHCKNNVLKV